MPASLAHRKRVFQRCEAVTMETELIRAATALLEKIDNITIEDFSNEGEQTEREALRVALANYQHGKRQ